MAEITRPRPLKPVDPVEPAGEKPHRPDPAAEPLWRDALGHCLRRLRLERGETLVETSRRAGVSPQYLSEMERGVKEPSSEMIAAVAGALDVTLGDLTLAIATTLLTARAAAAPARPTGATCQATAYALAA
ncbi:XRE family transcriptional regulator [Actinomadura sp. KC216]|uniref:helix-turn-helix domain-containing protein n=1 Tax=Actinomadura sp. KC216 TaxID=2530370 RepID=UPI00104422A6|nr:helix-turn-helix transcriptional regulator [Actinomadura sp. KC216]TDB91627.1 XRE family transcriptional regulator [Actinomadura sp. KC216]